MQRTDLFEKILILGKIEGGRNINNFRYADDKTTFVAESEEELKSLLMKVKEES